MFKDEAIRRERIKFGRGGLLCTENSYTVCASRIERDQHNVRLGSSKTQYGYKKNYEQGNGAAKHPDECIVTAKIPKSCRCEKLWYARLRFRELEHRLIPQLRWHRPFRSGKINSYL